MSRDLVGTNQSARVCARAGLFCARAGLFCARAGLFCARAGLFVNGAPDSVKSTVLISSLAVAGIN